MTSNQWAIAEAVRLYLVERADAGIYSQRFEPVVDFFPETDLAKCQKLKVSIWAGGDESERVASGIVNVGTAIRMGFAVAANPTERPQWYALMDLVEEVKRDLYRKDRFAGAAMTGIEHSFIFSLEHAHNGLFLAQPQLNFLSDFEIGA